jgi:regulator of protease activity HflC (stomatin/prohibitin superfamily)
MSRAVAWIERWIDRHFVGVTISGLLAVFFVVFFFHSIFITISAGHGGALWLRFFGGTVERFRFGEGTKMIFPWDKIYIYDLRVQQESAQFDVLSKEGLQMAVDVTLRFRLNPIRWDGSPATPAPTS